MADNGEGKKSGEKGQTGVARALCYIGTRTLEAFRATLFSASTESLTGSSTSLASLSGPTGLHPSLSYGALGGVKMGESLAREIVREYENVHLECSFEGQSPPRASTSLPVKGYRFHGDAYKKLAPWSQKK